MQHCDLSLSVETLKEVIEDDSDVNICKLRFLNCFYSKLIEKKQLEITRQRNLIDQAKTLIDHNTAKENLHRIQSDCVDLCCYWLNELICMQILQDKCAQILHQLMVGNCHWFLAQYGHLRSRASLQHSCPKLHYDEAIAAYCFIIDKIKFNFPKNNKFYAYVLEQFSQLILDAKNGIDNNTLSKEDEEHISSILSNSDLDRNTISSHNMETATTLETLSSAKMTKDSTANDNDKMLSFGEFNVIANESSGIKLFLRCPCFLKRNI